MSINFYKSALVVGSLLLAGSVHAQVINTVAGTYTGSGYSGDGGAATAAQIGTPNGIAVDTAGNFYFSDNANSYIRKVTPAGIIHTIAGNGSTGYSGDGGRATSAALNYPQGLCVDLAGNVYFADAGNYVVRKISTSGIITTVAGIPTSSGYSGDGGAATAAYLNGVSDVAIGTTGNLYIADGNSRVRMVNTSGIISTFAGGAYYDYAGDGGAATDASLNGPTGVAVDKYENVYIADNINNVVRKVSSGSGVITTVAGNGYGAGTFGGFGGTGLYLGDGGYATDAYLNQPNGVSVDFYGNLYIADQYNNVVRMVDAAYGTISTYVGDGTGASGYAGDGGAPTSAELNFAGYTAVDRSGNGNLYIADLGNNVIRKTSEHVMIHTAATTVCEGAGVLFTSTTNITGTVHYQWAINAAAVGTDASTFSADSVNNGDVVSCIIIGGGADTICRSNSITMTVISLPSPAPITGGTSVCVGSTVSLAISTPGGTWRSSNISDATIDTTGVVTGVGAGTISISYTLANLCGNIVSSESFTVNPLPNAGTISGIAVVETGTTRAYTESVAGGVWSSSNTAKATVDAYGTVTGVDSGSVNLLYSYTNVCGTDVAIKPITIVNDYAPFFVNGSTQTMHVCTNFIRSTLVRQLQAVDYDHGQTLTWSMASAPTHGTAFVDYTTTSTGGAVYSSGAYYTPTAGYVGTDAFTVTISDGFVSTNVVMNVIVDAIPAAPTVTSSSADVCVGSSVTLTGTPAGGTWSRATTNVTYTTGGVVTGVSAGMSVMNYKVASGTCGNSTNFNLPVTAPGSAAAVLGGSTLCTGATMTMTDSRSGGTWSSSNNAIATVNSAGVVTGVTAGAVSISYTYTNNCGTVNPSKPIVVKGAPSPGFIAGAATIAVGATATLRESVTGGTWSSSTASLATISAAGLATGVAVGADTIIYTVTGPCGTASASRVITITAHREENHNETAAITTGSETTGIKLYPNPTTGMVTIEVAGNTTATTVVLTDMSGRTITTQTTTDPTITFDMSNLPAGVYLMNVNAGGKVYNEKVVVQ